MANTNQPEMLLIFLNGFIDELKSKRAKIENKKALALFVRLHTGLI